MEKPTRIPQTQKPFIDDDDNDHNNKRPCIKLPIQFLNDLIE